MMKTIIVIAMLAALALSMHFGAKEHTILDTFEVHPEYEHVKFTAYGRDWVIDLQRAPAVSEEIEINAFEGRVRGEEETTRAHFNFQDSYLDGVVQTKDELYWIDLHPETSQVSIYKNSDMNHNLFEQILPKLDDPRPAPMPNGSARAEARAPSQIRAYVIWDSDAPSYLGNWRDTVLGMFSTLNSMVNGPQGIAPYSVTMVRAQSCANTFSTTDAALAWLQNWAGSNGPTIPGANIVSMVCAKNFGGLAYVGTACDSRYGVEYKTGVSGATVWTENRTWSRAYSLRILAHENGHTLGAPHYFHDCYIMDYCYPQGDFATQVGTYSPTSLSNMRNAGCL